ncbi:putative Blue copper protein [Nitrospira sp. KM1]|uniref:cupredoxin domain-containing protein n=1 Tax=Nitrospira sp. KM1 TaxID=1936990 RepID=UPI0013A767FB|nr:cupredoxin domain-containing protein [Nitrospira sp. KM1]BCA54928.1 putative Blue copper protein [Nitrospira sp. KM1]
MKRVEGVQIIGLLLLSATIAFAFPSQVASQSEQQSVDITIKDYTFVTVQGSLRLGRPTVLNIRNEDKERHDFGSTMLEGLPATIEKDGIVVYGRGLGGVMLDPQRDVTIRFNTDRPGRYKFQCSIHPEMKGELLLLFVEGV